MKRTQNIIDFQKELEIQKISRILSSWMPDAVSFLRYKLEHPPQNLKPIVLDFDRKENHNENTRNNSNSRTEREKQQSTPS